MELMKLNYFIKSSCVRTSEDVENTLELFVFRDKKSWGFSFCFLHNNFHNDNLMKLVFCIIEMESYLKWWIEL